MLELDTAYLLSLMPHRIILLSFAPEASSFPSGENTTLPILPAWASRVRKSILFFTSTVLLYCLGTQRQVSAHLGKMLC